MTKTKHEPNDVDVLREALISSLSIAFDCPRVRNESHQNFITKWMKAGHLEKRHIRWAAKESVQLALRTTFSP